MTTPGAPGGTTSPTDRGGLGHRPTGQSATRLGLSHRRDLSGNSQSSGLMPGDRATGHGHGGGLLGRFFGVPSAAPGADTSATDTNATDTTGTDTTGTDTSSTDNPTTDVASTDQLRGRERFALTQADRLLAKRLADIDHLRDVAMHNGNTRLLNQADYLEQLARAQYARRTAGYDVPGTSTDPTSPTDPTTPTDPTAPTDPTTPTDQYRGYL